MIKWKQLHCVHTCSPYRKQIIYKMNCKWIKLNRFFFSFDLFPFIFIDYKEFYSWLLSLIIILYDYFIEIFFFLENCLYVPLLNSSEPVSTERMFLSASLYNHISGGINKKIQEHKVVNVKVFAIWTNLNLVHKSPSYNVKFIIVLYNVHKLHDTLNNITSIILTNTHTQRKARARAFIPLQNGVSELPI